MPTIFEDENCAARVEFPGRAESGAEQSEASAEQNAFCVAGR